MQFPTEPVISKYFSQQGDPTVIKWEVLSVCDGEILTLSFESVASSSRQGVWMRCDGGIEIDNQIFPEVTLWSDTAPSQVKFTCHSKDGHLHLYNVFDRGQGRQSQLWMSGMKAERRPDFVRYRCNDSGPEVSFDRLVFTVSRH